MDAHDRDGVGLVRHRIWPIHGAARKFTAHALDAICGDRRVVDPDRDLLFGYQANRLCAGVPDAPKICHAVFEIEYFAQTHPQDNHSRDEAIVPTQKHVRLGTGYFRSARKPDRAGH